MIKPIKCVPECIYGNPCQKICINSSCRKPGFICEHGLKTKSQCALFHEKCEKMDWSQLENIICENPNTKIPEFFLIQEQMESLFGNIIKKVKEEHLNFTKWVRVFGFSSEVMSFINMVNDHNYNNMSGYYMNQILSELFMNEDKKFQLNFDIDQCKKTAKKMEESINKIKYLYGGKEDKQIMSKNEKLMSVSTNFSLPGDIPPMLESKITQQSEFISSLFNKQVIKKTSLLYRASQNAFSAQEFHKKCDNIPNTLTLVETEYGKVIGGFTPLSWNSSKKHWAADKSMKSFIFSVDLKEKFNLNLAQFAVACNPDKGPIFGCCDICIVDQSNIEKSNAEFPISYNNLKYSRNPESSQAFIGNVKGRFTTREWEVFRIEFTEE